MEIKKRKLLKRTMTGFVAFNVLATTAITGLPIHSMAAEATQKQNTTSQPETQDNSSKAARNIKAATSFSNVKFKLNVVDVNTGKPVKGYVVRFLSNGTSGDIYEFPASDANGLTESSTAAITNLLNEGKSISLYVKWDPSGKSVTPNIVTMVNPSDVKNNEVTVTVPLGSPVQKADLGNQQWLVDMAEYYTGKTVGTTMSFPDLAKITTLQSYTGFEMKDTTPVLPAGIKYFTGLKTLKLSGLGLTGTVPAEVGSLTNLTTLNLAYNQFAGNIPAQISQLTNLQTLYLGANPFTGVIPGSFINLKKVSDMDLSSTNLTGTIDGLPQMTSLQRLRLENTKLVGQIPDGLFHMDFNDLDFRNTELTLNQAGTKTLDNGKIPKYTNSFVNERSLIATESTPTIAGTTVSPFKDFGLKADINGVKSDLFPEHKYRIYRNSDNKQVYYGKWDDAATFEQTTAKETYRIVLDDASANPNNVAQVTVGAPKNQVVTFEDLGKQYWLKDLAEHYTGKIVDENMTFGDLESITALQSYPGFEVKDENPILPAGIKYFTGLQKLDLSKLGLTGNIPTEVSRLSKLTYLNLNGNSWSGTLPSFLGDLTNLEQLRIENTPLTGSIPKELGNLAKLKQLRLANNQLSGSIPKELGNLSNLTMLFAAMNKLSGSIPAELGNLTKLTNIRVDQNQLVGQLPESIFALNALTEANFSSNEITLNQEGSKAFANGLTPNVGKTYVTGRQLTAVDVLTLEGKTVRPFQDFNLQTDISGTKSPLFDGHTYQIYRTTDNQLVYSGPWDENASFEQTGASEGYRVVLDGASENPHNVTTITVNQKQEVKGNIQVVVKDDAGNVVPGVTVGWKDLTTNFTGNGHVTDTDGAFSQTGMSFEHQYQYTVSSVPAGYVNTGDTIKVTPSGQAGDTYVVNLTVLRDVTIQPMTEMDNTVTGTAAAGAKLRYFVNGQAVNVGNANADGTYSKVVGLYPAGTVIGVQMQNPKTGKYFDLKTITVTPVETKLTIQPLTTADTAVTGTAPAGVKLRFLIDGQAVNVGYANADGTYSKVIGQQKAGTVVGVQMFDPTIGNYSDVVSTTVKQAAASVKVAAMTTTDTAISGTAPANAKLRIIVNGQAVNVVYANASGQFTKVIGKQAEGTVVGVERFNPTTGSYEKAVTTTVTLGNAVSEPAKIDLSSAASGKISGRFQVRLHKFVFGSMERLKPW
ncbi:leucine-rich repeat domain-containing protein [Listeria aquatica]|uniref:leucine-rich repeat domain-containing protein n=1 Tax=Listeria aquatica TaxID=1494960 RepID=UPI0031F5B18D